MPHYVETLIPEATLHAKVAELAARISAEYAHQSLLVVGVLKGAFVFCADLIRQLRDVEANVDFIACSSYGTATESSGAVRILKDLDTAVEGRHVLLVEDIVDTGLTLRYLRDHLERQGPASCVFARCWTNRPGAGWRCRWSTWASTSRTSLSSATASTGRSATATCLTLAWCAR